MIPDHGIYALLSMNWPLDRFSLCVAMSVCSYVYISIQVWKLSPMICRNIVAKHIRHQYTEYSTVQCSGLPCLLPSSHAFGACQMDEAGGRHRTANKPGTLLHPTALLVQCTLHCAQHYTEHCTPLHSLYCSVHNTVHYTALHCTVFGAWRAVPVPCTAVLSSCLRLCLSDR